MSLENWQGSEEIWAITAFIEVFWAWLDEVINWLRNTVGIFLNPISQIWWSEDVKNWEGEKTLTDFRVADGIISASIVTWKLDLPDKDALDYLEKLMEAQYNTIIKVFWAWEEKTWNEE